MIRALIAASVVCTGLPAWAQEAPDAASTTPPPESSLTPKARPGDLKEQPAAEDAEPEVQAEDAEPEAQAEDTAPAESNAYVAPDNEVEVVDTAIPVPDRLAFDDADMRACRSALDALGVEYETADPIAAEDDPACGIRKPLRINALPGGVALEPAAPMRCETARALAEWVSEHVLSAADRLPQRGKLVAIDQGSTYICRRRNNLPEGKLSEHSFGNAVDVMGFRFAEGKAIPIQPREREGTMAEAFQDAVRSTACLHFTTVLGPGTDAAHADHLHLDVLDRRGDFRLCQ